MVFRPAVIAVTGALALSVAVTAACGGKKGSGSAFGPKEAAVEPPPAAPPPVPPPAVDPGAPTLTANQLRQLTSVVGRMVGGFGTANNTTPIEGVKIYGNVDKKKIETVTDKDGFFWFKDIPVMSETGVGKNLTLYIEKEGWELVTTNGDLNTDADNDTAGQVVTVPDGPDGINNSFQIEVRASPDAPSAFQIDLGPIRLREALLKVTTSLHHASRGVTSRWLVSGATTASGFSEDIYLADPKASITLTFNRPIDTGYSDHRATNPLVEFYDPKGAAVAFAGSWDATKTVFTIDPAADLVADNDDSTNYRIVIARPVRAIFKDSGSMHELKDVKIVFNVLPPTAGDLLASQAPSLDPQGESFTAYVFDGNRVHKKSLRGSTTEDFTADATTFRRARIPAGTGRNTMTAASASTGTTLTVVANGVAYSSKAQLFVERDTLERTVNAVAANTITVDTAISRPSGASVRLKSFPETLTIQSVNQSLKRLTFTASLKYPHRAGAAVTKSPQDWVEVDTDWNSIDRLVAIGDTVLIDTLPASAQTNAHADRTAATVAVIDGPNKRLRQTVTREGLIVTPNANLHLLGDAVGVTTVPDVNGNAMEAYDNRFNTAADNEIY